MCKEKDGVVREMWQRDLNQIWSGGIKGAFSDSELY